MIHTSSNIFCGLWEKNTMVNPGFFPSQKQGFPCTFLQIFLPDVSARALVVAVGTATLGEGMNEGFCTALIRFHLGTGNHPDTWESNM